MFIFKTVVDLQVHLNKISDGKRIGFVPTMGALHHGHITLIKESNNKDLITVCSIFVNPTQFNNASDLQQYPVSIDQDIKLLAEAGCDVLFLPSAEEMYGNNIVASKYDYGNITGNYEGAKRPGHFDGVLTIVSKLFDAVGPDEVFFGQKDLQQCMVVNELIKRDFNHIVFNMVPIQREENGLAASSRNRRLTADMKAKAANLYHALIHAKQLIRQNTTPSGAIKHATENYLKDDLLKVEYFDLIDATTMNKAENLDKPGNYAVVIACWCADVRLIDNVLLTD